MRFFEQEQEVLGDLQGSLNATFPKIIATVSFRRKPAILMPYYKYSLLSLKRSNEISAVQTIDFAIQTLEAIHELH